MEIEGFEVRKLEDFVFYSLEIVIREVKPLEVLGMPHHEVQDVTKTLYCAHLVVVQEQGSAIYIHLLLALSLNLGIFLFPSTHLLVLVKSK